jgi:uncharacterized protein (TIGR03083 family)
MALTTYPEALADLDPFGLFDDEVARCNRHFTEVALTGGWDAPTGCEGWSVRDMLAHLHHSHRYDVACLEDAIPALFAEAAENGVTDLHSFNAWGVRLGRERDVEALLEDWRTLDADVRARFRARGRDGTLPTMVGQYNIGLQSLHLAFEHAVHGDDMGVEVAAEERPRRLEWRARFTRWMLENEKEDGPSIEVHDGLNRVTAAGETATLDDEDLVLALTGRLSEDRLRSAPLRSALHAFG